MRQIVSGNHDGVLGYWGDKSYLRVGENSGDVEASRTFHVHKETVWCLNKSLELVFASLITL